MFKKYDYSTVDHANCTQENNKVIKIRCWVEEIKNPEMKKNSKGEFELVSEAKLSDEQNNTIYTTNSLTEKKFKKLKGFQQEGTPVDVIARIKKTEVKNGNFKNSLKVSRMRSGTRPSSLLKASAGEIEHAKVIADRYTKKNSGENFGLFKTLKKAVIEELGIVGEKADEMFNDSIDAMICQAFSGGTVNNANGKIHTCIIGPPSSGKKLMWGTARLLNVVSQEAQASRTTPAGLTATMVRQKEIWSYIPGKIPLASGEVFGIQDLDKRKKKGELFSILGDVMEDGRCVISGATRANLRANAAIHFDLNRQTDLFLASNKLANVVEDTQMPAQIISRIDFIIELERNLALQNEKAISMLRVSSMPKKRRNYISKYCHTHDLEVGRLIKLIVAYVMEEFAEIDRDSVLEYMEQKFRQIKLINEASVKKIEEMSMFKTRMANSIIKFIDAITRIQLLDEANQASVDLAFKLLSRKLDFLRNISPEYLVPGYRKTGKDAFGRWLSDQVGDERFSIKTIRKFYIKEGSPCNEVSDRTFRNWVSCFADRKGDNQWKVKAIFLKAYSGNAG